MDKQLKHFIGLMKKYLFNEVVYWCDPRPTFEVLYVYKDKLKEHFPNKAQMIDELCETDSEQAFLKVLQKYQTDDDKKNVWVHQNKEGYLYLV